MRTTRGRRRRRRPGPARRRRGQPAAAARRQGWRGTRRCDADDGGGAARRRAGEDERGGRRDVGDDEDGGRHGRRRSGETEEQLEVRTTLRRRRRRWRRRSAYRRRGRGGQRRNSGGNTTVAGGEALPEVPAENRGQAGEEEAAATPGKATARPGSAWARRERRLEAAGTEEREGRRWERTSGDGIFSSPDLSLVEPLADFDWVAALEDGASVPELRIVHIFGVNLIQVTHFMSCVEISSSLLGYHACHLLLSCHKLPHISFPGLRVLATSAMRCEGR
uniref:Uncharacterized protein n=1 Tax=Oryza sativa subsp. japonica TaxID=39947 RepID=Q6EQU3_ORYSJ|nr:hypothetical protein [Oryza sativa Japonica Group]